MMLRFCFWQLERLAPYLPRSARRWWAFHQLDRRVPRLKVPR